MSGTVNKPVSAVVQPGPVVTCTDVLYAAQNPFGTGYSASAVATVTGPAVAAVAACPPPAHMTASVLTSTGCFIKMDPCDAQQFILKPLTPVTNGNGCDHNKTDGNHPDETL